MKTVWCFFFPVRERWVPITYCFFSAIGDSYMVYWTAVTWCFISSTWNSCLMYYFKYGRRVSVIRFISPNWDSCQVYCSLCRRRISFTSFISPTWDSSVVLLFTVSKKRLHHLSSNLLPEMLALLSWLIAQWLCGAQESKSENCYGFFLCGTIHFFKKVVFLFKYISFLKVTVSLNKFLVNTFRKS